MPIVVFSELVANEPVPVQAADPRLAAELRAPLKSEDYRHSRFRATLAHRTQASGLRMVAAMDHEVDGPDGIRTHADSTPDVARLAVGTKLEPGQRLRIVRFLAYVWSSLRSVPALQDQVEGGWPPRGSPGGTASAGSSATGSTRRGGGDVVLEGDPALQQAVRFAVFQVVQAAARADERGIPAKGLTGSGDDGHTFWDMEAYMLPMLTYVMPFAARDALRWRHATIDLAEARARELGLNGVAFPWRTIRGQECSGYRPASAAAFHINAAIADAVRGYLAATEDGGFERGDGLELMVATARLWRSLGYHDAQGGEQVTHVGCSGAVQAGIPGQCGHHLQAARALATMRNGNKHNSKVAANSMPWLMTSIATSRRRRSSAQDPTYFFCPTRLPVGGSRRPAGQPPSRLPPCSQQPAGSAGGLMLGAIGLSRSLRRRAVPRVIRCWQDCSAAARWQRPYALGTRTGGVSAPARETRWQLLRRHPRTAPAVRA